MDAVSSIVMALATGAAAALKPTAEKVVKDVYAVIKAKIQQKYGHVSVDMLENDPGSEARQNIIKDDLDKAGASNDKELLKQAKDVLDTVARFDPDATSIVGVELEDIKGASLRISDIISAGNGVKITKADISGDIEIKGIRAGDSTNPPERQ